MKHQKTIKLTELGNKDFCPPPPFCQTPLQLANPTQLQLVGVGVDVVFPWKKEGTQTRRKDPTCLNFGDCLLGVRRVFGSCLVGV